MLENGTYTKSAELQDFFTKYKEDSEFTVYLQLYVTNNRHCKEADEYIKTYKQQYVNGAIAALNNYFYKTSTLNFSQKIEAAAHSLHSLLPFYISRFTHVDEDISLW